VHRAAHKPGEERVYIPSLKFTQPSIRRNRGDLLTFLGRQRKMSDEDNLKTQEMAFQLQTGVCFTETKP